MSKIKLDKDSSGNSSQQSTISPLVPISGPGIPRSPSHESFATDLSLMSLSSLESDMSRIRGPLIRAIKENEGGEDDQSHHGTAGQEGGATSWGPIGLPIHSARGSRGSRGSLLQVPSEHYGGVPRRSITGEILFEEETEVIRSCGALSSVLGLMKSFSTTDITQAVAMDHENLRPTVSEVALFGWHRFELSGRRLDCTSRSCSTWVAVGDMSTTSQLPSPQAQQGLVAESPTITAVDFVRSVNKKVRQMYIRRRLLSTYRALERLTRSELDLEKAAAAATTPTNENNKVIPQVHISAELDRSLRKEFDFSSIGFRGASKTLTLTVKDIEREKGKPLTKYERNMMIFNWLQTLDENAFDQLA